jgi:hypothetical protein
MTTNAGDPRKARLDAAVAELAHVDAVIWRAAAAARVYLQALGDPGGCEIADTIQSLEDRKACARADITELGREMGVDR